MGEYSKPGDYCYNDEGVICEHQRIDSPDRIFVCSGRFEGECVNGSKYSFPISKIASSRIRDFSRKKVVMFTTPWGMRKVLYNTISPRRLLNRCYI